MSPLSPLGTVCQRRQKIPIHKPPDLLFHWEVRELQVGNAKHMPRKD